MNPNHNKRIFITGATGFLGSYVLRLLVEKGYTNIRALKRVTSRMNLVEEIHDQVEWIEGDILDVPVLEEALEDVDWVIHCAAMVSFDPRKVKKMTAINHIGTANMVNLSIYHGIERFIHVSSIAALGKSEQKNTIDENAKWENHPHNSAYSLSKYQSEMEVWRGMGEGLNVAIVNPSVILGAGFWEEGGARFFKQVWEGLRFHTPGATGFVDVRDCARFIQLLLESDIISERFVLNGENLPFREVFDTIANLIDKPKPSICVTPLMKSIVWRVEWLRSKLTGKAPMVTKETANAAMHTYAFDNQKSLDTFDFTYTPISKTLADTSIVFKEALKENLKPKSLSFPKESALSAKGNT